MEQIGFQYQDGDILLLRVNHFRAWYRWLFAKLICFFDGVYYHHAQIYSGGFIYEADTTVKSKPVDFNKSDEIMVLRPIIPLTEIESKQLEFLLDSELGREYDYWGAIFHQLVYIMTFRKIWIGKTGRNASRKPYCTELVSGIYRTLRGYFPQPYLTSPSVLQKQSPNYFKVVTIIK